MGKKSRERKQNMYFTPKEQKTIRKDIYEKLYVGKEHPIILWFSEDYKDGDDPAWEKLHNWIKRWETGNPHGTHSIPEIMYNLRSLVENGLEKIHSGKDSRDVIYAYYPTEFVGNPLDERSKIEAKWSFSVFQIGEGLRQTLPTLSDIHRMNPFLSSWIATDISHKVFAQIESGLKGAFGITAGSQFIPQA